MLEVQVRVEVTILEVEVTIPEVQAKVEVITEVQTSEVQTSKVQIDSHFFLFLGSNVGGSSQGGGYNPGGGSYNPGGSSQSGGNYGGNGGYNPDNGLNWNNDPGYNDPSNKREVRATVVFKVTDEMVEDEDDTEPWTKIEYGAESDDETCTNGPGEPGCDLEYWWVKFRIQDEDSGLHLIDVKPGGKETYQNQVYYR